MEKIHIIFSPHLDDAVFSLGGFIAKHSPNVVVITFFAGHPSMPIRPLWDRLCGFNDSAQAIKERIIENDRALSLLKIPNENIVNLCHLDIQYRLALGLNTSNDITQLKEEIYRSMEHISQKYGDSILALYAPSMKLHPDHAIIHDAFIQFFRNSRDTNISKKFYLYQDLPYTYYFYLKQRVVKLLLSGNKIIISLPLFIAEKTIAEVLWDTISLTKEEFKYKIKAIQAYKSQFIGLHRPLLWLISHFARLQAKILKSESEHCEVIYQIIKK